MKNMKKLDRAALITATLIAALFLVGIAMLASSPVSTRDPTRRDLDRSMVVLLVTAALFVAAWASLCWLITKGMILGFKLYNEVNNTSDDNGDRNADLEEVKIEGNQPAGLQKTDDSDNLTEIVIGDTKESVHDAATLPTEVQAGGNERGIRKKLARVNTRRLILELPRSQAEDHLEEHPDEIVIVKEDTE